MKTPSFTLLFLPILLSTVSSTSLPIYALISTPSDFPDQFNASEYSYIKESFPQMISLAGGNSVFVPYDLSDTELFPILDAVDGVLFIGGDAQYWSTGSDGNRHFTYFMTQIQKILQYTQEQNAKGRYLPLIGVCQGMEVTLMALTDSPYMLDTYVDANEHGPINITSDGMQSRMFASVTQKQAEYMAVNGTLFFNHMFGFNLTSLDGYQDLKESLTLTGIADDTNNKVFMAAIEAKKWPMYLTMFHPERVIWEQSVGNYSHSAQNMKFVLDLAVFMVEEAQVGGLNDAPKDVLDNWYFDQYEPIDVQSGTPRAFIAWGDKMVNTKKIPFTDNKRSKGNVKQQKQQKVLRVKEAIYLL